MAEIHVMPGVERRDLAGPAEGDASSILQAATWLTQVNIVNDVVIDADEGA